MLKITTLAVSQDKTFVSEYWKFAILLRRTYKQQLTMQSVFYIDECSIEDAHLQSADIVIILLSQNFLINLDETIEEALQTKKMIPIILKPCTWKDGYVFSRSLQVLDNPVSKYSDKDDAWFAITAQLERIVLKKLTGEEL